ncbi:MULTISPECIES: site-specific integrase [Vibrio harveyi group]|uniref:site-specific integrase n=1 Tax=Vibrio harveyi group TaxID=717610 RepID=UPI00226AFA5C|nr:site-specific integrase [Vibrio parahaemolyticus]MCX8875269.1 site-specific integrase [Vibrio parahaemolyticus]
MLNTGKFFKRYHSLIFGFEKTLEKYINWKIKYSDSTEKDINQNKASIIRILSIINIRWIHSISIESAERSIDELRHYPKNATKNRILKNLSHRERLRVAKDLKTEKLADYTIKKDIEVCSTFFNWCISRGYAKENPFRYINRSKLNKTNKRQIFTPIELERIFTCHLYKKESLLHSYYYWIPLLLRYTGARLNELCCLEKEDLKSIEGIYYLSINDESENKRIKNSCSHRSIPLHRELIRLGFIDFVNRIPSGRIFSSLKPIDGYYSHSASNWFSRVRQRLNLGIGKDAHSFRHTFTDELYQNEVPEDIIVNLVGHGSSNSGKISITRSVYSKGFDPRIYQPYIDKISSVHTAHIRSFDKIKIKR